MRPNWKRNMLVEVKKSAIYVADPEVFHMCVLIFQCLLQSHKIPLDFFVCMWTVRRFTKNDESEYCFVKNILRVSYSFYDDSRNRF
jgi:hypothetical protein